MKKNFVYLASLILSLTLSSCTVDKLNGEWRISKFDIPY